MRLKLFLKINLILLSIFILFNLFLVNKTQAASCPQITYKTYAHFDNNNSGNTVWETHMTYAHYTQGSYHTVSKNLDISAGDNDYSVLVGNFFPTIGYDFIHWYTACVDPNQNVKINSISQPSIDCRFAEPATVSIQLAKVDTTCYANKTSQVQYRGCGNANRSYGYVRVNGTCPANTSNDCVKGGYVDQCSDGKSVCNTNCTKTTYSCNYNYSGNSMCRTNTDTNNRGCVNNGSCDCITNNDCSNNKTCNSHDCVNRYGCQADGQCVKRVGGQYASSDCNNKCGPVDECSTDANCSTTRVCGTGNNACVRYGTTCEFVGTGIQRHKECVKNTNNIVNQNAAVCGNNCPVGPDIVGSAASCDSSDGAAITLRWSHIPYEDNYDLYYKRQTSGTFNRIGKIAPQASGANSYTIEGLAFNTQYNWYVIGHTTGTQDDPTVKSATANITTGARTACLGNLTINTFVDYDGNGVKDASDVAAQNIDYLLTTSADPGGYASGDTGTAGSDTVANLPSNSYAITVSGIPSGWTMSTNNPQTKNVVPPTNQVANFGMQPPAPTCTGGLTANPTLVHPGISGQDSSSLSAVGCRTSDNKVPDYKWPTPDHGTTVNVNQPNTTWSIESTYNALNTSAHPTVSVCNPGSNVCRSYEAAIQIVPYFTITGSIFVDANKDGYKNNGDANYTAGQTRIRVYSGSTLPDESVTPLKTITNNTGTFNVTGLNPGTYTVSYASKPSGYFMTYPKIDGTPKFTVTIGTGQCVTNDGRTSNGDPTWTTNWKVQCNAGNITNLNYGINPNVPWIQSGGSDIWFNNGFTNSIPAGAVCTDTNGTAHGAYTSIRVAGSGTPGIIFSGNATADFGGGQASINPYNWQVGDIPGVGKYPESYTPSNGVIKTSYNYLLAAATKNGLTIRDITSYCGGNLNTCDLPDTAAAFPNGIYKAEGDLHITTNTTFPAGKNYVILVHGDLYIDNEIHIPKGSTAIFSAGPRSGGTGGNIIVDKTVGINQANNYDNFQVEGWYSADRSFTIDGENNCPTKDYRLNMAGAVVINAGLNGGSFVNNRDRCSDDANCPVFFIQERPDFTLNAPTFLQIAPRIWREVAP